MGANYKKVIFDSQFVDNVYFALQGETLDSIPGVENAFADGSVCDRCYKDMLDAYARLLDRLGLENEDKDVEIIINSLRTITDELCYRMFYLGAQLADTGERA